MTAFHYFTMAGIISSIFTCLLFIPIWFVNREHKGGNYWLAAELLTPFLYAAVVFRNDQPSLTYLITLNILTFAIPIIILLGMQRFYAMTANSLRIGLVLLFTLLVFLYFFMVNNNELARIIIINQFLLVTFCYCIWRMVKEGNTQLFSDRFFIFVLSISAFQSALRNIWLLPPNYIPDLAANGALHTISMFFQSYISNLPYWFPLLVKSGIHFSMPLGLLVSFSLLCSERQHKLVLKLKQQAEHESQYRQTLLNTLSHELRTPLNGIAGTAQLLKQRHKEQDILNACDTITHSAMDLADMASKMLEYSYQSSNRTQVNTAPCNLHTSLEKLAKLVQVLCDKKQLTLLFAIDDDVEQSYLLDWPRLHGVLINLLGNAVKFTHKGEITLFVKTDKQAKTLNFEVKDTGIGIPPNDIDKLQQPFQRASNINDNIEGAGFGLAIANKKLALLNSELQIESLLGVGSRFYFYIHAEPCSLEPELNKKECAVLHGLRILLIEDNELNYKIVSAMLAQDNHHVSLAVDGKSAIKLSQTTRFDVVLLDMRLPDLRGDEVYQQITQQQSNPNRGTPFIAVTANLLANHVKQYQDLGISWVVGKPISQHSLQEAIFQSQKNTLQNNEALFNPAPLTWIKENLCAEEFTDYMQKVPNMLATSLSQIEQAMDNDEQQKLNASLHKLAGSAAQLGLMRLTKLANHLENMPSGQFQLKHLHDLQQLCTKSIKELT